MSILNVDITDVRGLNKYDQEQAFKSWRDSHCPEQGKFSFEGEKQVIAGKERTWKVVSFGDYQDTNRNARRFISYRCGFGNLSWVVSWLWDDKNKTWLRCADQRFGSW